MKTEADTRAEYIDPMLTESKWGHNLTEGSSVLREFFFTDGRKVPGNNRGKRKYADYILVHKNQKLAIVEAKAEDKEVTEGLEQVKDYARLLNIRLVYSTNGKGIYLFDMETGKGDFVENYLSPDELYRYVNGNLSDIKERLLTEPFHKTKYDPRYYQENAINAALEAIADERDRVLLTLATGTGKTFIAFQIVWKLFQTRWNKRGDERRPRILFLADRNILIEQAMSDFNPLEKEFVRVNGEEIRKRNGEIPTNANIFFSIYQAMTGGPADNPFYQDYPSNFFDLIIIDECHRGGAADDSNWRAVLDHFKDAVHLGMTATPKREDNKNTYEYFGDPLYTYSLKDGIEDGFLTPFKVQRISTTLDQYSYGPGDQVVQGEMEKDVYEKPDFNKNIIIPEREEALVKILLKEINQEQKTIVFCRSEDHALMVRDFINKHKNNSDPDYCVRVTASEGAIGDQYLRVFKDNEKTIPTILTTSQKLSTGVDSRNLRYVVLMRPVGSMVEFKQIVGRGTRVYEGKDFFTIIDFYDNHTKFDDPEWDGEAIEVEEKESDQDADITKKPETPKEPPVVDPLPEPEPPKQKLRVQLSPHRTIEMDHMIETLYFDSNGKAVTPEQFLKDLFNKLPDLFADENSLRRIWANPETRLHLLEKLEEKGFDREKLDTLQKMFKAEDSDVYDVLRFIAFDKEIHSRKERVDSTNTDFKNDLDDKSKEFVDFVLQQYERNGFEDLNNLTGLLNLKFGNSSVVEEMGGVKSVKSNFYHLQEELYKV